MARYLTDLADVLRAAGLTVVEIPGWETRGRRGSFDPHGVLCHHTAGKGNGYRDAESMAKAGRPDLNPPLCQLALDRQGVWYVCAAGRANHAGRCRPVGGLKPYPGRSYGDGNAQMIGVEAQNDGSEPWPPVQYASYVRGVAAITEHYRWHAPLGHKETSLEGKPDPSFDMNQFRRDVKSGAFTQSEEDDMTPEQDRMLRQIYSWQSQTTNLLKYQLDDIVAAENEKSLDKIAASVAAAIPPGGAADPATVKAAVRAALREIGTEK